MFRVLAAFRLDSCSMLSVLIHVFFWPETLLTSRRVCISCILPFLPQPHFFPTYSVSVLLFLDVISGTHGARVLASLSPSFIFLFQDVLSVFICGNASGTIGWCGFQRLAVSVHSPGIQCRPNFSRRCSHNLQPRDSYNARHFTSGNCTLVSLRLCTVPRCVLFHQSLLISLRF